jgi:DNA modification methylase
MKIDSVDFSLKSCDATTLTSTQERPFLKPIPNNWRDSAVHKESTLHQLSPYIGKIKSSMAKALISSFTSENETIYDPYSGSGTVALESWAAGRKIIANDLSPYAVTLTKAKLFPILSIEQAYSLIEESAIEVERLVKKIDLRKVPEWVKEFFHPETLRETIAWFEILKTKQSHFLISCLLGILHHQRPGFLSFPSSHTVPYLREKKFPRDVYSDLYNYRSVKDRLERKVARALKRVPALDSNIYRSCEINNAEQYKSNIEVHNIITSPPYMRQLDYGRDNRLRLWFLGTKDWESLDHKISPNEALFFKMFKRCLKLWKDVLCPYGKCILIVGDSFSRQYKMPLPDVIEKMALIEIGGYTLKWKFTEEIPYNRRVRKTCNGNQCETILVFERC